MAHSPKVLGEKETYIILEPFSKNNIIAQFPPNTSISFSLYINNTSDIPYGTPDKVVCSYIDWTNSQQSVFNLDAYNYGKYFENYPVQYLYVKNNMPVTMKLYFQYIEKQFYEYSEPIIQDLTQLQLTNIYVTTSLLGGCNFKYAGLLSDLNMSTFPIGTLFYLLDFQVYSTSSTLTGAVTVPWVADYKINYQVGALGVNEDPNLYTFIADTTTQLIPSSTTSNNAIANWSMIEFYSNMSMSATDGSKAIVYNQTNKQYELIDNITTQCYSSILNNAYAVGADIKITFKV